MFSGTTTKICRGGYFVLRRVPGIIQKILSWISLLTKLKVGSVCSLTDTKFMYLLSGPFLLTKKENSELPQ